LQLFKTEMMMMMMMMMNFSRAWGSAGGNIRASATESLGCCELRQNKLWIDDERPKLLDQRK
jgi:hypothetical protein